MIAAAEVLVSPVARGAEFLLAGPPRCEDSTPPEHPVRKAPRTYAAGSIMMVTALGVRHDLNNSRCLLKSQTSTGRWRVELEDTGEVFQVKPENLKQCLVPQHFRHAGSQGML